MKSLQNIAKGILFESKTQNNVVEKIIAVMGDEYDNMLDKLTEHLYDEYVKDSQQHGTTLRITRGVIKESMEIKTELDIARSIGTRLLESDTIVSAKMSPRRGVFELTVIIERDGVQHYIVTEVISAGGYAIQAYHYRYITRTNLPKINKDIEKIYKDRISRVGKLERLEDNLVELQKYADRYERGLSIAQNHPLKNIKYETLKNDYENLMRINNEYTEKIDSDGKNYGVVLPKMWPLEKALDIDEFNQEWADRRNEYEMKKHIDEVKNLEKIVKKTLNGVKKQIEKINLKIENLG